MRIAAYVRVSRVAGREGPSFISPSVQRERIAAWAKANAHEVIEWIEDLDQPGSKADRPGLNRAMALIEGGHAGGIVVAKLDRFGRSVVHLGQLVERLKEADGALFSVAEGVDTRGTTGKLIADILTAIAEWELERIRENWAAARAAAKDRGVYLAEAPVGFKKVSGKLVANDTTPLVREVFKRRISGDSWSVLAGWLDSQGVPARRGGTWTVAAVRRLVTNPVYVEYAVVSRADFEAAGQVTGVAPARSGRASGLLSGVLRCAHCRYAMKLSTHSGGFTEYRCKSGVGERAGGRCPSPTSVKSSVVEPFVLERFWEWVGDYSMKGASGADLETAEVRVTEAERELDAALDTDLAEVLGADNPAFLSAVKVRKAAVDEAREALGEVRRHAEAELMDMNLRDLWPDLTLYEQRKLLAAAFDCVFVRRGGSSRAPVESRVHFCMAGMGPDLPRQGQRWTVLPFKFPATPESG